MNTLYKSLLTTTVIISSFTMPCYTMSRITTVAAGCISTSFTTAILSHFFTKRYLNKQDLSADENLIITVRELNERIKQRYSKELEQITQESAPCDILSLAKIIDRTIPLRTYYDQLILAIAELKHSCRQLEVRLAAWKSPKHSTYHLLSQGTQTLEEVTFLNNHIEALGEMISAYYPILYLYELLSRSYDTIYNQEMEIYHSYEQQSLSLQDYVNKLHFLILTKMSNVRTPYPYLSYIETIKNDLDTIQGAFKACARVEGSSLAYQALYDHAQNLTKMLESIHAYIATSEQYQLERIKHEQAEQLHKIAEAEQQKASAEAHIAKMREEEVNELKKQNSIKEHEVDVLRQQNRLEAEKLEHEMRFQPTRIKLEQEIAELTKNNKQFSRERHSLEQTITGLRSDIHDLKSNLQRLQLQKKNIEDQYKQTLSDKEKLLDTTHRHLNQLEQILLTPPNNPASLPDEWPDYFNSIKSILFYLQQELMRY